jgi:hypothetical protein
MAITPVERKCDYCRKELEDQIWTLQGYIYKCCSAKCLLMIHLDPRVMNWKAWLKDVGLEKES